VTLVGVEFALAVRRRSSGRRHLPARLNLVLRDRSGYDGLRPVPVSTLPSQQVLDDAGMGPMANWTLVTNSAAPGTASLWGMGGMATSHWVAMSRSSSRARRGIMRSELSPGREPVLCGRGHGHRGPERERNGRMDAQRGTICVLPPNLTGDLNGEYITSDGFSSDARLDLAIYRSRLEPSRFAFFFVALVRPWRAGN
jgi:hypothetical protein